MKIHDQHQFDNSQSHILSAIQQLQGLLPEEVQVLKVVLHKGSEHEIHTDVAGALAIALTETLALSAFR